MTNTIVLKIKFYTFDGEVPDEFCEHLNHVLNEWNEGRYPFDVEQIQHGLQSCVDRAIRNCFSRKMREKYGNEMVQTGPQSWTARADIELGRMTLPTVYLRDSIEASLEESNDE